MFNSPLSIGSLTITQPLALAPVAEFTHAAFRQLVAELGGCGLFYTEMLNARIVATQPLDNDHYLTRAENDRPLVAQLVGDDPGKMALAAARLTNLGFDAIDINMGCSRQRIMRFGWGLALMEDQEQAARVIRAVRSATSLPLLVKMRSGRDHDTDRMISFAGRLQGLGVDGICLHPRSAKDGFKRPSRWEEIARLVDAISLPVIGNGDVLDAEAARRMFSETGCAAVMIGRGAMIRPWLFSEIESDGCWQGNPLLVMQRYAELLGLYLPAQLQRKRLLLFLGWYLRNWPFHRQLFSEACRQQSVAAIVTLLQQKIDPQAVMMRQPFSGRL